MFRLQVPAFLLLLVAACPARSESQPSYPQQLLNRHAWREAVQVLEDMAASSSPRADTYTMLATAYLGLNQPDKAVGALERGIRPTSGDPRVENYFVALVRRTMSRKDAQARILDALYRDPQSAVFQKAAARVLFEINPQDERAGALLARATREIPDDAEGHFFFGQWLCLNQREPACVQELEAAAEKTSATNYEAQAQIWSLMGTAQQNMGNTEEAAKAWRQALNANQSARRPSPELNVRYSAFLRATGREGDADNVLRETIHRNPDFGPAHFEAAEVAFRKHDYETAAREGGNALKFSGFGPEERRNIHYFLAAVYNSAGRYGDAEQERIAAEQHP